MGYQSGPNVVVAFKEQTALGSAASGADAIGIRARASQGLQLTSASIRSGEVRRDGQTTLGRLGSQFATAEYETELSVGSLDTALEAALRGSWTAAIALDETDGGDLTVGTATLTRASGSWITDGVRAGQVIKLSGHSEAANNDRWVRVLSVTATIITCPAGSFTAASADTAWDLTVAKHLTPGSPPEERYFTVEEHMQDVDASKVGTDMKFAGLTLGLSADNVITVGLRLAGRDVDAESSGDAPVFTSPVFTETQPLVLLDGYLRVNGADKVDVTGFSLNFDAGGQGLPVATSRISPDVFLKNAMGSGSISAVLNDLAEFQSFKDEDEIELFLFAAENESDPADFVSIYIGFAAYRGHSSPFGQEGGVIETMPFEFGVDNRGTGYFPSMIVVSTSAA